MGCGQRYTPAALPPRKTQYLLYRRLGGTQGRSGEVRKISPPPGFDPRTVQLVGSLYPDYATRLHVNVLPVIPTKNSDYFSRQQQPPVLAVQKKNKVFTP
jgi:hypothetical protein